MSNVVVLAGRNAVRGMRNASSQKPAHSTLRASHSALLSARGLVKSYRKGKLVVPVLKGVDFHVREGGFIAVVGQSGCGKTTLLHLLGTLDAPDAGEIQFDGRRIDNLPTRSRD